VINEFSIQAIGVGDIEVSFMAADPSKYKYEEVVI
jgi:hypothetical protein